MAVRCATCGRLSRDEAVCEWCREEIPAEERQLAAARVGALGMTEPAGGAASMLVVRPPRETAPEQAHASVAGSAATLPAGASPSVEQPDAAVDAVSREEARAAAATVPEEERETDEVAALVDPDAQIEAIERRQDRDTLVILVLIMLQLALTLYLGRLSSWWSVTGILWLLVGWGVKERAGWALALPGVLFALDVAFLLFGVGPRERAGFAAFAPLDFFLYVLRVAIWGFIWRLRDELA
jgi:hypothetical protein